MKLLLLPQTEEEKQERLRLTKEADELDPEKQLYFSIMDEWLSEFLMRRGIAMSSAPWAIRDADICLLVSDDATLVEV